MLNFPNTKNALFQYVKSVQTIDPCVPKLAPDLVDTTFAEAWILQELKGLENLIIPEKVYSLVEEFIDILEMNIPIYDVSTSYNVGDIVKYDDGTNTFYYVCTVANVGNAPSWDSDFWETNLSAFFRKNILNACAYELQQFLIKLQNENTIPSVMNAQPLHSNYRNKEEFKFKDGGGGARLPVFRGVRFTLAEIQNIQIQINKIGLYLEEAQVIPFYLYHSSQPTAIQTLQVEITAQDAGKFVWKSFQDNSGNDLNEVVMNFLNGNYDVGGYFWLGFYEDDITGVMYTYRNESLRSPYRGDYCGDFRYWFTEIYSVEIDNSKTNKPNFFDLNELFTPTEWDSYLPFNLQLRAVCNYTYGIEENPKMYSHAVAYYAGEKILRTALNSIRRNEDAEFFRREAQLALYGANEGGVQNLEQIRKEIESNLTISLHELDSVCFKKKGLRRVY